MIKHLLMGSFPNVCQQVSGLAVIPNRTEDSISLHAGMPASYIEQNTERDSGCPQTSSRVFCVSSWMSTTAVGERSTKITDRQFAQVRSRFKYDAVSV